MPTNKEVYGQTNMSVLLLCVLYSAAYVLHGTLAGLDQVSRLRPGLWFSWQPLIVILIAVAAKYEMKEPTDKENAPHHSTALFAARRSAQMSAATIWCRCMFALALLVTDLAYLFIHGIYCFSLNCSVEPTAQCCAEGSLYGVALIGVLAQVVISALLLFVCSRLPFLPSFYLTDPLDNGYTPAQVVQPTAQSNSRYRDDPIFGTPIMAIGRNQS